MKAFTTRQDGVNGITFANDALTRTTRAAIQEFEEALSRLEQTEAHRSPEMRALMRAGMESQLEDLREQLAEYETAIDRPIQVLEFDSLEELPDALIQARLAAGLTLKQLATRLKLRERRVQRYEETRYAGVGLARLQSVVDALGIQIHERFVLPASMPTHSKADRVTVENR